MTKTFSQIIKPFSYITFSIVLVTLLNPRPFSDITRGIIYGLIPLYGLISIIYNRKQLIDETPLFFLAFIFNIFICFLIIIHRDFMTYGFCVINNIFFCYASFYKKQNGEIQSNIEKIILLIILFSLFFSIVSLLIDPIFLNTNLLEKLHNNKIKFFDDKISHGDRLYGLGGHPNTTGAICFIGIICSMYEILSNKKNKLIQICSFFNIPLCVLCIIMASSRTSMLAVTGFSFVFLVLFIMNWRKMEEKQHLNFIFFCLVLIMLFAILAIYLLLNTENPIDVIKIKILRTNTIKGATGRVNIQEKVIELSKNHLLLGIPDSSIIKTIGYTAHNAYIQVLASAGILGLFLYLAIWAYAIYCNIRILLKRKTVKSETYLLASFLLSTIIAALLYSFYEATLYLDLSLPTYFITYCTYLSGQLWSNENKES